MSDINWTMCPECHGANVIETGTERSIGQPPMGEYAEDIDWVVETIWLKCWDCLNTWTEYHEFAEDRCW